MQAIFIFCIFPSAACAWETAYVTQTLTLYVQEITDANILYAHKTRNSSEEPMSIKFYGIGIPTVRQPFGREAHDFLVRLLPKNAKVIATIVGQDEGMYNALVQYQDHSVNNRLVNEGLAWVERSSCKAFFCRRWYIQEHIALKDKRGIWSLNSVKTPWQWSDK